MSEPARTGEPVAVVLTWRGRIGLFKGGAPPGPDAADWCCLHGVLGDDEDVVAGAARVVLEATGLGVGDLEDLRPGPPLRPGRDGGAGRPLHTIFARTDRRRLSIDGAHVDHRWVRPGQLGRFDGQVSWLRDVVEAVLPDGPAVAGAHADLQPVAT